jgi:hypothetical protein
LILQDSDDVERSSEILGILGGKMLADFQALGVDQCRLGIGDLEEREPLSPGKLQTRKLSGVRNEKPVVHFLLLAPYLNQFVGGNLALA